MRCACGGRYSSNKYLLERHLFTKRHQYYLKLINEMRCISLIKNNKIAVVNELKFNFKKQENTSKTS